MRGAFEAVWGVTLQPEPGLRIPNMFDAALDGSFKGLYCQGEDIAQSDPNITHVAAALSALPAWSAPAIHDCLNSLAAAQGVGLGKLAQPVRVAVSGGSISPPIDATLAILGREETLARLSRASGGSGG